MGSQQCQGRAGIHWRPSGRDRHRTQLTAKVLAAGLDPDAPHLESIMIPDQVVLAPDAPLPNARELMRDKGFSHLTVEDADDEIVVVVLIRDLPAAVKEKLEEDVRR